MNSTECFDEASTIDTLVGRYGSGVVLDGLCWMGCVGCTASLKGWKHSQGEGVNVHQTSN